MSTTLSFFAFPSTPWPCGKARKSRKGNGRVFWCLTTTMDEKEREGKRRDICSLARSRDIYTREKQRVWPLLKGDSHGRGSRRGYGRPSRSSSSFCRDDDISLCHRSRTAPPPPLRGASLVLKFRSLGQGTDGPVVSSSYSSSLFSRYALLPRHDVNVYIKRDAIYISATAHRRSRRRR